MRVNVTLGIEQVLDRLAGQRVGLVCNPSSVDHDLTHAIDLLHGHCDLRALFGPQHGVRADVQDNMIETEHTTDSRTALPVHSLYSETREPTAAMLRDLDVLVVDLQDVGCRIYTYVYTMANCMRVARAEGKRVIVCDRPNPIGGEAVAGVVLDPEFASFVGLYPIPTRHGMTIGELAQLFNAEFDIGCDLDVVKMKGWRRELWFDETDVPWVMPSPNVPTLDSAIVFPGTVHMEGTMMSEGRGTTRPFELIGAPYIDPYQYAEALTALALPGVRFRPASFQPTFQKHAGVTCGGVQLHVTDRRRFEPVMTGIAAVKIAHDLYPQFLYSEGPYEYVFDRMPFDVIAGTDRIRKQIADREPLDRIVESWEPELTAFRELRERYLLY